MDCCSDHSMVIDKLNRAETRLNSQSETLDELKLCLSRLTTIEEQNSKRLEEYDKRIGDLEDTPKRRITTFETALITALITAIITYLAATFLPTL